MKWLLVAALSTGAAGFAGAPATFAAEGYAAGSGGAHQKVNVKANSGRQTPSVRLRNLAQNNWGDRARDGRGPNNRGANRDANRDGRNGPDADRNGNGRNRPSVNRRGNNAPAAGPRGGQWRQGGPTARRDGGPNNRRYNNNPNRWDRGRPNYQPDPGPRSYYYGYGYRDRGYCRGGRLWYRGRTYAHPNCHYRNGRYPAGWVILSGVFLRYLLGPDAYPYR